MKVQGFSENIRPLLESIGTVRSERFTMRNQRKIGNARFSLLNERPYTFSRNSELEIMIQDRFYSNDLANQPSNRQDPLRAGSTASAQNAGGRMI